MPSIGHGGYVTDVEYTSGFYPQLAPQAMTYVAALNGVRPPDTSAPFRYLELGCGFARSLTLFAAAYPQGEFVAVDFNPVHTASIEKDVAAAELTNVRVVTGEFANLPHDLGTFDFITMHGVLSWVSTAVRTQVIDVARARLAPGGLLLGSYNAMPGWAHLQPIRGILSQYAALQEGDSLQRLDKAISYLVHLRERGAAYFTANPAASAYVDKLITQDLRYLVHEYLNDEWASFYFAEMAEQLAGAELSYTGSLPVHTNFWDLCVAPEFAELFQTTTDRIVLESHKDFCANTMFRWDLYAREPRMLGGVAERIRLADDVYFRLVQPDRPLPWRAQLDLVTTTLDGPFYAALVERLGTGSARLSELVADLRLDGLTDDDVVRAVDTAVATGMLDIGVAPLCPVADRGRHLLRTARTVNVPLPYNRAVLDAGFLGGRPLTLASPVTGSGVGVSDLEGAMLHELTRRGPSGIVNHIDGRLAAAGRTLLRNGAPVTTRDERRAVVSEHYDLFRTVTLPELVRLGVVTVH